MRIGVDDGETTTIARATGVAIGHGEAVAGVDSAADMRYVRLHVKIDYMVAQVQVGSKRHAQTPNAIA